MKNAIITGAYGKIGQEIAKGLVRLDYQVRLIGRAIDKLEQLSKNVKSEFPESNCTIYAVDLSRKHQIYSLASKIDDPIDVLVNNAATAPKIRKENSDGIELQWATNVLGYYWMIMAFKNNLLKAQKGKVVNVASYWAGGLDLNDPEFKYRNYDNDEAYRQSKQANRQMSYGLADDFKSTISINACHPGDVNSKLSNALGFGGSESAKMAAETPLALATTDLGFKYSGEYFERGKIRTCRFKNEKNQIRKLLEICAVYS